MENGIKACLICFKTNADQVLLELWDSDENNVSYSEKLQCFLEEKLVSDECTLLCRDCACELNSAYDFKKKLFNSQEFWRAQFDKYIITTELKDTLDIKNDDLETFGHIGLVQIEHKDQKCESEAVCESFEAIYIVQSKDDENNQMVTDLQKEDSYEETDENINKYSQFSCTKCSQKFYELSKLIKHKCVGKELQLPLLQKEDSERARTTKIKCKRKDAAYKCHECQLSFDKRWKYTKHKVRVHCEDKKFMCTFCNKSFKQSYHLREHITTHTGEKNYSCNVCNKTFQRISSQKRHMRTHTTIPGEKVKKTPFLCTICGKKFPYTNGAQRHMRIHTGEKKFECNICNRKFNQSTHLHVHLRTHTGERPYVCNICRQTFTLKASLRKHMKTHKNNKEELAICQGLEPNLSQIKGENLGGLKGDFGFTDIEILNNQEFIIS